MGFLAANHMGQQTAAMQSESQLSDIRNQSALQMRMQTEMGQLSMMVKLNEALAKLFKSLGDAIKGLVG
jgi:hypothetical protein